MNGRRSMSIELCRLASVAVRGDVSVSSPLGVSSRVSSPPAWQGKEGCADSTTTPTKPRCNDGNHAVKKCSPSV